MVMGVFAKLGLYLRQARAVAAREGVSAWRQLAEIARLRRGRGVIGPGDYYTYRLFDPRMPWQEKCRFVGWRAETALDALNDPSWHCLGLDKVLMDALFRQSGIRIPTTRAIYLAGRKRPLAGVASLSTEAELHAWLRDPANYPFFSKPSASGFGRGALSAREFDAAGDAVVTGDGRRIAVGGFAAGFTDREQLGYLFQTPVRHDERLVGLIGPTPSSLRVMVLLDETQGPLIHRAFWKIPTGRNMTDNFNSGITGNLAAAIDLESGAVLRVISGIGLDLAEVQRHPDTGAPFADLVVPDWSRAKAFVREAALCLPKLRFQQWDIALGDEGPVALEVNLFGTGGCDLTQLLYRKGLLDDAMLGFLQRHAGRSGSSGH